MEFVALWSRARGGALPPPFTFVTDIPYYDDFQRELRSVRNRLQADVDPRVDELCAELRDPDLSVEVRGGSGADWTDAKQTIRLRAVRCGSRGYLAKQLPGKTYDASGGFTITECDPLGLAAVVVAALPKAEAGKGKNVTLPMPVTAKTDEGLDHSFGTSNLWDSFDDDNSARAEKFEQIVPVTEGYIVVRQGRSVYGPRGQLRIQLGWRDLPDDGRYVIGPELPPIAQPADDNKFAAMINKEIAKVIQTIKDERASLREA
ncbi:ESX secretion-associated protein EspG [Nocardia sp. NPDC051832]|uniref:ESX secretion-associated protein EspG n=1 Tax=Nocardia sp. NPDC051832 TaxID=3155673 RepID=UPI00342D6A68